MKDMPESKNKILILSIKHAIFLFFKSLTQRLNNFTKCTQLQE